MMELLQDAILNLDKSEWVPTKFGEVAYEPKESSKDPAKEGLEHIVGLEHIDSEDVHLRRSASIDEGSTFTKVFRKGDVLFGRRRAYLKKAAQADFDGICSGDITVFRASDKILPSVLPFVVNNEKFFDYAVKHSAGGLSPRVKFKDLANYEFLLPPKDQQAQLAELLWAMDEVIEREIKLANSLTTQLNTYIKQIFSSHIKSKDFAEKRVRSPFQTEWRERAFPKEWKSHQLRDLIDNAQNGFAEGKRDENGIPQLRMNNVTRAGRIDLSKVALIPSKPGIERYLIKENDVMFCNTNSEDLVGKSIIANSEIKDFSFSNHFTRLRPKVELVTPRFLYLWLKYHFDIGLFERICTRWIGQAAVQSESLLSLYMITPPLQEQLIAADLSMHLEHRIDLVSKTIERSQSLQKSLINQIF